MRVVAIKEMSAGNDRVGDMWKETKIFSGDTPVVEVIKWGKRKYGQEFQGRLQKNLILTEADE